MSRLTPTSSGIKPVTRNQLNQFFHFAKDIVARNGWFVKHTILIVKKSVFPCHKDQRGLNKIV